MIADLEIGDTGTYLFDDAGTFVATEHGGPIDRDVTGVHVVIRMADAGCGQANQDLTFLRVVQLDFFYGPSGVRAGLPQERPFGSHVHSLIESCDSALSNIAMIRSTGGGR